MYPLSNKPKITTKDIDIGYVMRYFAKSPASKDVIEIDKKQYEMFKYDAKFTTIELKWLISGLANDTVSKDGTIIFGTRHRNTVTIDTYNIKMPGLNKILRNPLEYFQGVDNRTE